MAKLIKNRLAKIVAKSLKRAGMTLPATLIKVTPGTRGGTVSAGTNPTSTSYPALGWINDYLASEIDGTLITAADRRVCLLGATIGSAQVPTPNDQITIDGTTYTIQKDGVSRDAAAGVYTCHCRS